LPVVTAMANPKGKTNRHSKAYLLTVLLIARSSILLNQIL